MFHAIEAHEWMNDAHVHKMQVQMWKPNTWGVTALPLIKISSRDLTSVPLLIEFLIPVPQIIFSFPHCIAFTTLITPHDLVELDHPTPSHSLTSVKLVLLFVNPYVILFPLQPCVCDVYLLNHAILVVMLIYRGPS